MRLHYYAETDSLYIEFRAGAGVETRVFADGVNADLDGDGLIMGLDIDRASRCIDFDILEFTSPHPFVLSLSKHRSSS